MEKIFEPNLTSRLLLKAAAMVLGQSPGRFLELGAGSGWITSQLLEERAIDGHEAHLSDISQMAIDAARTTFSGRIPPANIRRGRGIQPWHDSCFQVVVNDIAALSEPVALASSWYAGVQVGTGVDGLNHCVEVEPQIWQIINPSGSYIVPLISLSHTAAHLDLLHSHFGVVSMLERTWWPIPKDLQERFENGEFTSIETMFELRRKYGRILAYTQVVVARNPRGRK
jgi:hypothetical protein